MGAAHLAGQWEDSEGLAGCHENKKSGWWEIYAAAVSEQGLNKLLTIFAWICVTASTLIFVLVVLPPLDLQLQLLEWIF